MRKLATALAVSIALSSNSAHALSLGEIEMRSALNQPMSAEIRLSSVRANELQGMIVKLASPEAFARAGIDRTESLSDLRFSVDPNTQSIVITSQRPIVEPFLNFLLEVDWTSGRMVREYTVLLDPPVFMSPNTSARADTAADSPAFVQRGDDSLVTPTPIQRDSGSGEIVELESLDSIGGVPVTLDGITTFDTAQATTQTASQSPNQSFTTVNVDEDEAIANARAAGAAARANIDSGFNNGQSFDLGGDSGGEVVSLGGLGGDTSFSADSSFEGGEVVTLTDLGAPNPQARAEFNANRLPSVELLGGGVEAGEPLGESVVVTIDDIDVGTSAGGSVTVQRGDTLGTIAQRVAGAGVSPQQMMLALLAANESAFINGNINLVRAGATLRIPSSSEATGISQSEALASINDQNRLWQDYRDGARSSQRASQVARASQAPAPRAAAEEAEQGSTLSADAAAILENARTEVLRRDELSIVADNDSTTTAASATADESTASDANRLGEINRKLQLAREELASSRLQAEDLGEQSDALQNTGENLDTLVTLQQNDIAKLQAQLDSAQNESSAAIDSASDAASGLAGSANDLLGGAADSAGDATDNALAGAGEQLESVELVGDNAASGITNAASGAGDAIGATADSAASATAAAVANAGDAANGAAETSKSWLDGVMSSNLKWIPIGLLGLFGAGLLGVLFMGRRKKSDFDDAELDDVEFFDEMDELDGTSSFGTDASAAAQGGVDKVTGAVGSGVGAAAAAGGAGVAGVAAAVGLGRGSDDDQNDNSAADEYMTGAAAEFESNDEANEIDPDDTISEVDVYLAYGLHGQAEELLTKAIDKDEDNPEYHAKLLETYAAQGNAENYAQAAGVFEQKFGTNHELWAGVAAAGSELDPGNSLFSGESGAVASMGMGGHGDEHKMRDEDFLASGSDDQSISSINRGNTGMGIDAARDDAALEMDQDGDESHLMDQSIDPAFAFDEADLEATGDFSQIASEIAADGGDDTSSLDFPSFESAADSAKGAAMGAAVGVAGAASGAASGITDTASGIAGTVGDQASDAMNDMSLNVPTLDAAELEAPSLDGKMPELSSAAEDLTLDLNQLSGDMELDSTELLDDSLTSGHDLDIGTTSDDTLLAGTDSLESVDEMDTMMDLAKAYIDMGDNDSASSALDEIVKSGSPEQVSEAETLKRKIS